MQVFWLVWANVRRRGWYFILTSLILAAAATALVVVIGFLSGVRHRLDYVEAQGLKHMAVLDPRYEPEYLLSTSFEQQEAERAAVVPELAAALRREPGVSGVGYVYRMPLFLDPPGESTRIETAVVNADLGLEAGLPLSAGRWFSPEDWAEGQAYIPAVVSREWAERYPLGSTFEAYVWRGRDEMPKVNLQVVGVIRKDAYDFGLTATHLEAVLAEPTADLYLPELPVVSQDRPFLHFLFVIAESEQALQAQEQVVAKAAKAVLQQAGLPADPQLETMNEITAQYRDHTQEPLALAVCLTAIVILLSTFGFGSLNAISVWERRQEYGIHFAAGATRMGLVLMIRLETLIPIAAALTAAAAAVWVGASVVSIPGLFLNGWTLLWTLAILLPIALLSSAAPVLMVRKSPASLIKGT